METSSFIEEKVKFEEFKKMMTELGLYSKHHSVLQQNGFDEWTSVNELNNEILEELGISDELERQQILACLIAAKSIQTIPKDPNQVEESKLIRVERFDENGNREGEEAVAYIQEQDVVDDVMQHTAGYSQDSQARNYFHDSDEFDQSLGIVIKKRTFGDELKGLRFTKKVVQRASYQRCGKNESLKSFFGKVVSLYFPNKGYSSVESMGAFTSLRNLDFQSNNFSDISMFLKGLRNLQDLNLMRNEIAKIEGLQGLQNLLKLNLSKNRITRIEGLQFNQRLQELKINAQRIKTPLIVDDDSMIAISNSLILLECEENKISNLNPFRWLVKLQTLKLKGNDLKSIFDLEQGLVCLSSLRNLDVRKNALVETEKWRDYVVMMGLSLTELNEKKVLMHEREFLFKFHKRRNERAQKSGISGKRSDRGLRMDQTGRTLVSRPLNTPEEIHRASDPYQQGTKSSHLVDNAHRVLHNHKLK